MAHSFKLAHATHILANICIAEQQGNPVSSTAIAESLAANPSQVRQIMGQLRRAGLIETYQGSPRTILARPAEDITMLDVYRAVEGDKSLLHLDTHINAECGIGQGVQRVIQRKYDGIQQAAETAMQQVCLLDIITEFQADLTSNGEALKPL